MRKLLSGAFFVLGIVLTSCSSDNESPSNEPFFNLNVGSKWVYKRYQHTTQNPGVFVFKGTDSVEVEQIVNLNGLDFAKIRHKTTDENAQSPSVRYAYQRVNNAGQLVGFSEYQELPDESTIDESSGFVFHPGENLDYENTYPVEWGSISYYVLGETNVTVEGNAYTAIRYVAEGTPTVGPTRTAYYDYEAQTGRIRSQTVIIANGDYMEDRLTSYDLN